MKKYYKSEFTDINRLINKAAIPSSNSIRISFKGYTADDLNCKYCLHYGGKSKGCRIAKCCCEEEKQQAAITAVKL